MSRFALQSLLCFFLLLAISVFGSRVLKSAGRAEVDFVGLSPASLTSQTRALLERLDGRMTFTLFVSPRERMPSHLKEVEGEVRALLAAFRSEAPNRVDTRVIYPGLSGDSGAGYAARRKVSPISVRRIEQDEHGEEKVWSSLVLSFENHPEVLIQGIEDTHLPYLEQWVRAHLQTLFAPPQADFAFSAPAGGGFVEFPQFLSQHGPVVQVDLDRSPYIPPDTDMLFWFAPQQVTERHVQQLKRFVASGRTAVLAGSSYEATYHARGDSVLFRMVEGSPAWSELLRPFGLRPVPDLVMDRNAGPLPVSLADGSVREVEAPFHLRNLPAFRDFRRFLTPARGGLSFVAASPLAVDPGRAAQAGYDAQVVATTTEHAWVRPLTGDLLTGADLAVSLTVPKQNLMVLLTPRDPWAGQLVVLASASAFRDGILRQPGYGHSVLIDDLVRTFASRERLIRTAVDRAQPEVLPPLTGASRLLWRLLVAGLAPVLILGYGWWRFRRSGNLSGLRLLAPLPWVRAGAAALLLVIALAAGVVAAFSRIDVDLTAGGVNTPAASVVESLALIRDELTVDLVLSPRANLPASLKTLEHRAAEPFAEAGVELTVVRPEGLPPPERKDLAKAGIVPFEVEQVRRDTVVSKSVWSGLLLRRGGLAAAIPRLDGRTSVHLDFLIAAALRRLESGEVPLVSVVSDLPRLSPAEALEDYQKKGLSAPGGTDVYSHLKRLLAAYGYRVHHVNPRYPQLAPDSDLVLWMQPRRDSGEVILQLSRHLAGGGTAVVAMQHFNIQQRQYRGTGFETVYWPQPQFQDLDRYLRLIGVEQVRQVLMDRTRHRLRLDTQVNRTAVREYDAQEVALPFLIRTVGERYDPGSPITRDLGDLLFIWGNSFDLAGLPESFAPQVLISTSPQSWSFPWKGGWLPPESLTEPEEVAGPQPLAVDLRGEFPEARFVEDEEGRSNLEALPLSGRRGRLVLVGCSEMFKNGHLQMPGFDHDQLLLNLLADAVYGPDMTRLQARNPQARGFAYHDPAGRAVWRLVVIGAAPLALGAAALIRYRRRASPAAEQS